MPIPALRFLQATSAAGAVVLAADPARALVPRAELTVLTTYDVPVLAAWADVPVKPVTIYQLR
jgi:predicted nicotinamide N-methyase